MKSSRKRLYFFGGGILIIVALFGANQFTKGKVDPFNPGELDTFTQCIADKGAKFYGAFWCGHCQNQKRQFGGSASLLPYIECSAPDRSQLEVCKAERIESYPTWVFGDGSRLSGEVALSTLAEKTGCTMPQA